MFSRLLKKQNTILLLFSIFQVVECVDLDFRAAAFFPNSRLFRNIYGTVSPSYQIEASWFICDCLKVWSNLSVLHTTGRSIPLRVKATLEIIPISAGLKWLCCLGDDFYIYAGAGVSCTWLKEKNKFCLSNKSTNVGGIVKLGISKEYKCLVLSLFTDYQLQRFKVRSPSGCQKVNADGLLLGGGIGIFF